MSKFPGGSGEIVAEIPTTNPEDAATCLNTLTGGDPRNPDIPYAKHAILEPVTPLNEGDEAAIELTIPVEGPNRSAVMEAFLNVAERCYARCPLGHECRNHIKVEEAPDGKHRLRITPFNAKNT